MAFIPASPTWDTGAVPTPAYSGTFIPAIWSGKLLEKFYSATVLAAIANTDYEGEIKGQGDTVYVRQRPSIAINEYVPEQSISPAQRPSADRVELSIDKGFYFNTVLDDVMDVQADLDLMSEWAADASEQMKIRVDTEVLAYIGGDIVAANQGDNAGAISGNLTLGKAGAPVAISTSSVIDHIVYLSQVLDEQNVPETGRWLVIPAWMSSRIKRSELRDASLTGDGQTILRNGRLGMIERFTVYMSNLLPYTAIDAATTIYAGHRHGLTFASQMDKVETLRAESTFGTLFRGLQVYGRKVVDGKSLAMLYATPA